MSTIEYTIRPAGSGWVIETEVGFMPVISHYGGTRDEAVKEFRRPFEAKGVNVVEVAS